MKTLGLLGLLFAGSAMASPIHITSGEINLGVFVMGWSFVSDGFSAQGTFEGSPVNCGFCVGPFQLKNPLPFDIYSHGSLTLNDSVYQLGPIMPPTSPYGTGTIFFTPHDTLPTINAAGTYDAPFDIAGSFCLFADPKVFTPSNCISVSGGATAHYTVIAITGGFYQPLPTIQVHAPEPSTWMVGMPLIAGLLFRRRISAALSR